MTFTTAATAELRERIRQRIADTLARLDDDDGEAADPFVRPLLQRLHGRVETSLLRQRLELALA